MIDVMEKNKVGEGDQDVKWSGKMALKRLVDLYIGLRFSPHIQHKSLSGIGALSLHFPGGVRN